MITGRCLIKALFLTDFWSVSPSVDKSYLVFQYTGVNAPLLHRSIEFHRDSIESVSLHRAVQCPL